MQVSELMAREVKIASPEDTLQQAARWMAQYDIGALPVGQDDRLLGIITDRDIVVRGDADGRDPTQTLVGEILIYGDVRYCFDDEEIETVAHNMAQLQVRRLPVLNRSKRLVGMISLGDIAAQTRFQTAGFALRGIPQRA